MRTFQEHQNEMIKHLREHAQKLYTENANAMDQIEKLNRNCNLLIDALNIIAMAAADPTINDIQVLRTVINREANNYLDTEKRQG
jgi:hypothetical protein